MMKSLSIVALIAMMAVGTTGLSYAIDPPGGQSSSELNSLNSRSGSPSETGKTGIGSTSGTDASIDTGLKATSQNPCPPAASQSQQPQQPMDMKDMKSEQSTGKPSAADAAREAMATVKKSDSTAEADNLRNPDARSSAESSSRMSADAKTDPCAQLR
jgi:hypothetical protein